MRDRRSLLNFAALIIVATGTTVFVLSEARKAVEEINRLSQMPVYLAPRQLAGPETEPSSPADVSTWKTYRNKIVYTVDQSVDTEPLKKDCAARGGRFNACGNICPPDAEVCAEVCAFTCEFKNK